MFSELLRSLQGLLPGLGLNGALDSTHERDVLPRLWIHEVHGVREVPLDLQASDQACLNTVNELHVLNTKPLAHLALDGLLLAVCEWLRRPDKHWRNALGLVKHGGVLCAHLWQLLERILLVNEGKELWQCGGLLAGNHLLDCCNSIDSGGALAWLEYLADDLLHALVLSSGKCCQRSRCLPGLHCLARAHWLSAEQCSVEICHGLLVIELALQVKHFLCNLQ
mmetsp:Transcript_30632/g.55961  ORF Transcript_30632/g.55961 Transcript_30632/m.55961 type:complete len:223 (+) Transcript_30632:65-733(+)